MFIRADPDEAALGARSVELLSKDIEYFWHIISSDRSEVNRKVKTLGLQLFPEILANRNCTEKLKEKYVEQVKRAFKNGDLTCMEFIMNLIRNDPMLSHSKARHLEK